MIWTQINISISYEGNRSYIWVSSFYYVNIKMDTDRVLVGFIQHGPVSFYSTTNQSCDLFSFIINNGYQWSININLSGTFINLKIIEKICRQVGWGYGIHWLNPCSRSKTLPTNVLYMTLNCIWWWGSYKYKSTFKLFVNKLYIYMYMIWQ